MRPMQRLKRRRTGFTLVEMLVVMSIVAVLGVLTALSMVAIGRRSSREGAAEDVMGILRQARLSAVDSGRGALVRINSVERTLYGFSSTIEAAWHFEESTQPFLPGNTQWQTLGAKSMHARPMDGRGGDPMDREDPLRDDNPPVVVSNGAVGLCLRFNFNPDPPDPRHDPALGPGYQPELAQYVDCGRYPIYDPTDGIRLEVYVRPEGATPPAMLGVIGKGDGASGGYLLGLMCVADGVYAVHGGFVIDYAADPLVHLASYDMATGQGLTLAGSRWYHLALEFDGHEARLFVNGVLVDLDSYRDNEAAPSGIHLPNPVPDPNPATDGAFCNPMAPPRAARMVPARAYNLEIGRVLYGFPPPPTYAYFQGRIDEPKVLSVAGGRRVALPERVPIVASDPVIHFDRQGHLDIAYHSRAVYVAVGDPYQMAELAAELKAADTTSLSVRPRNPFPPTGGIVLVGSREIRYEVIQYASVNGLDLTVLYRPGAWPVSHTAGEEVLYGRLVGISPTGTVRRATGLP